MTPARGARVMFYVQHLLGIGHQARAAAITRAMRKSGLDVVYVSGGYAETAHDLAGADIVQLAPARTADARFDSLLDAAGQPVDAAWEKQRRDMLLETFEKARPDALLIESFPFGRRRFRFELLPLLENAAGRTPVAASIRDILVRKDDPKRTQSIVELVNAYFDAVIVHSDPTLAALGDSFPGAAAIAERTVYSGYVAPPPIGAPDVHRTGVLVSAGGGAVGGALLRTALAARPLSRLSDAPWRLVTGPNLPESEQSALKPAGGVTIDTYLENFHYILCTVAVSVSQAGYNTTMDLFATRTRSVLVPFNRHDETEQAQRAALLAQRGGFQVIAESDLSPATLAAAIDHACDNPPPDPSGIDLDGAARTAEIMAKLATGRSFSPPL